MGEPVNSMCAIYAMLIEDELKTDEPDMDQVFRLLGYIKRYCQTVGYEPGELPGHLEPHLFEAEASGAGRDGGL